MGVPLLWASPYSEIARSDIDKRVSTKNPWTFTRCGDNLYIHVVDRSGKCPAGKRNMDPDHRTGILNDRVGNCPAATQYDDPNWNDGIYTRSMF